MEREDQAPTGHGAPPAAERSQAPAPAGCSALGRHAYRVVGLGLAATAALVGLFLFLRVPPQDGGAQDPARDDLLSTLKGHDGLPLFHGWPRPDVVLLLSGQQYGYYQPCGCSDPQYGGLVRRYNLLQALKARGWPVVAADLGDVADAPNHAGPQTLLKYEFSMKALRLLDYTAVSFGLAETSLPLHEAMGRYALNNAAPRVVGTNLLTREKKDDPFHETVAAFEVGAPKGAPRVGVLALHGGSVEKKINDQDVKFHRDTPQVIAKTLADLKARQAEVVVLLYQGTAAEAALCVKFCAQQHRASPDLPPVAVALCLDDAAEPSGTADRVGDTMLVRVGHKGRFVGVVGAYRTGRPDRPWDLRYQLVRLGPEFATPRGKEKDHPVMDLIEDYAQAVKDGGFVAKAQRLRKKHPVQIAFPNAEYVGSDACKNCHPDAYKVWKESKHFKAHDTLVEAEHPRLRQHDPECLVCHVTGFGHEKGFIDAEKTDFLKRVGCESCHGPCSEHVDDRKNLKIRAAINPFKTPPNEAPQARTLRLNRLNDSCRKCHDDDNDVHWDVMKRWKDVAHPTPPRAAAAGTGK